MARVPRGHRIHAGSTLIKFSDSLLNLNIAEITIDTMDFPEQLIQIKDSDVAATRKVP